jgi:pyrroloquinoline-quinone synthase
MSSAPAELAAIDRRVAAQHVLNHPFYLAWSRGELSLDALQDYARQYYHHVAAFPTYLSAVHAYADDPTVRRALLANLMDEEAGDPNHPELWLQFAEGLGLTSADVQSSTPWPETRALIDAFRMVCRSGDTAAGVAALYAYESQIPAVSESKIAGLRRHYGVDDPRTLAYFEVHQAADVVHAADERALLAGLLDSAPAGTATQSADHVLGALWELLSGVCRRHDIACDD